MFDGPLLLSLFLVIFKSTELILKQEAKYSHLIHNICF